MTNLGFHTTIGLAGSTTVGLMFLSRHYDQQRRDTDRVIYNLEFPPHLTTEAAAAFVRSLISLRHGASLLGRDSLAFELVGGAGHLQYRLRVPGRTSRHVLTHLAAAVPAVRHTEATDLPAMPQPFVRELRLTSLLPLRLDLAESVSAHVLSAMATAHPTPAEVLVYQVVAYPVGFPTTLPTHPHLRSPLVVGWSQWLRQTFVPTPVPASRTVLAHREKLREPLFGVVIRVGASTTSPRRNRQLVNGVVGALHQLSRPGVSFAHRVVPRRLAEARLSRASTPIAAPPIWANAAELASLLAWPLNDPVVPGLQLRGGRDFPPSPQLPTTGRIYGRATYPGLERPVAITPADARMHTLLLGPTGSGKSTAMLGLIAQDLAAGRGLVLVDPNVALAEAVIARIPQQRIHDLIYLNPALPIAVPLNPLDCAPEDAELVADQVLEIIRDRSLSWGVTIDELLRNTLVLVAASPGMTMTEIPVVLRDEAFRLRLLEALDPGLRPTVGEFFAGFAGRSRLQQTQDIAAVLNKVSPLVDRRPIRAMLGQAEPTWTMRQVLEENKILIVALPSGVISPVAADIIGSLVVRLVWNGVLARGVAPSTSRHPVTLYLDELARFVGPGQELADLLARARGFDLDLVGALQHLDQAPAKLQAALLSEARNKVILQPAADDARLLARHLPGVAAEDLLALPPHTAMASLVAAGRVTQPVTLAMAAAPPSTGHGPAALTASRRYGRSRVEVEQAIQSRRPSGDIGGRRRIRRLP